MEIATAVAAAADNAQMVLSGSIYMLPVETSLHKLVWLQTNFG